MSGSILLQDFRPDVFVKEFGRELAVGQKAAGRKIGPKVVKDFRSLLGDVEEKRRQGVYFKVHKNGTFAAVDVGVNARIREYGGNLRPINAKAIRVNFDKAARKTPGKRMVVVGGKAFLVGRPAGESKDRFIAILKREVIMRPVRGERRLSTVVRNALPTYMDEMMKKLNLGGLNAR